MTSEVILDKEYINTRVNSDEIQKDQNVNLTVLGAVLPVLNNAI